MSSTTETMSVNVLRKDIRGDSDNRRLALAVDTGMIPHSWAGLRKEAPTPGAHPPGGVPVRRVTFTYAGSLGQETGSAVRR
ncbi:MULTISPECIES: hypothetical protein [Streptomyces violaceusniger group]|uniref:Uncharacterized protein n=2 Tax=Streptomyces rhizosphaericus TaxID=114699 RepID=A0ABP3ZTL9_9ACTN